MLKWHETQDSNLQTTHVQHVSDLSIKTSEELYTRTMQYQTQMAKPALDRPQSCQNRG